MLLLLFLTMPAIYCIVHLRCGIHKLINTVVNQVVDNDTELGGSVDSIKGGEASQRDLDKWEMGSYQRQEQERVLDPVPGQINQKALSDLGAPVHGQI